MLKTEIERAQRLVKTDAYQMSIGEVVSMYKEDDLIIDPDFQRLFRWEIGQKSRLFESLLLGIPLPSIFVFEREDAKWELIDGLQRVSTILEFMGLLKNPDGGLLPPSYLEATKYLPSLRDAVWEKSPLVQGLEVADQAELDKDLKLSIRRSRLAVEILKRPSDNNTKYDLFQRLNAGGTPANAQELRNCIIIMANKNYYEELRALAQRDTFQSVSGFTEDQLEKQRHLEYASRFMVHMLVPYVGRLDVEEYIDTGIIRLAEEGMSEAARVAFEFTFDTLFAEFGNAALRRIQDGQHRGKVSLAAFEAIAIGVAQNTDFIRAQPDPRAFLRARIEAFWLDPATEQFFSLGMRGTTRIQRTIPFGRDWFSHA